ncbi:hypothetical protein NE473_31370, partial [Hungatella sp. SL.1.14]|nr:hypothetical protein [Hungatella sp. SL.1.14]
GNRIANPQVKLEWRMQKALSGPGAMADFGSHMLDIGNTVSAKRLANIKYFSELTIIYQLFQIHIPWNSTVTEPDHADFTRHFRIIQSLLTLFGIDSKRFL